MKKVFIIHGFEGSPNGGWRPWIMAELEKHDIYACALAMPTPEAPLCIEWVDEIGRHIMNSTNDEIYLIGHSLGGPAILRFLEQTHATNICGVILVSCLSEMNENRKIDTFLRGEFDFIKIKKSSQKFALIHGDNDPFVPIENARFLSEKLSGELIIIKNGGHLNGASGFYTLPECLEVLIKIME